MPLINPSVNSKRWLLRSLCKIIVDLSKKIRYHKYKHRDPTIAVLTENPYFSSVETLVLLVQKNLNDLKCSHCHCTILITFTILTADFNFRSYDVTNIKNQ